MRLTKTLIVESVRELGFTKKKSTKIVDALTEIIKSDLEAGNEILIRGFGKFFVRDRKARRGRHPGTGEMIMWRHRRVVKFKCSPILRNKINKSWISSLKQGANYLDMMKDEGHIALFWSGHHSGTGWNLFAGTESFLEWAQWQVYYFVEEVGLSRKDVAGLLGIIKDKSVPHWDRCKSYIARQKKITEGFSLESTDRGPFRYEDLCQDRQLNRLFDENRKKMGLPGHLLCADHELGEEFLVSRFGDPAFWVD